MQNRYLDHLLKNLKEKQELSKKEYCNTNINTIEGVSELNIWYDTLRSMVMKDPPRQYVKCIIIVMALKGNVVSIKYKYYDEDEIVRHVDYMITVV